VKKQTPSTTAKCNGKVDFAKTPLVEYAKYVLPSADKSSLRTSTPKCTPTPKCNVPSKDKVDFAKTPLIEYTKYVLPKTSLSGRNGSYYQADRCALGDQKKLNEMSEIVRMPPLRFEHARKVIGALIEKQVQFYKSGSITPYAEIYLGKKVQPQAEKTPVNTNPQLIEPSTIKPPQSIENLEELCLFRLGFTDSEFNRVVLKQTGGNLADAIKLLLGD